MALHRLDLCTLTVESALRHYNDAVRGMKRTRGKQDRDQYSLHAVISLRKHFDKIDERLVAKCSAALGGPKDVFGLYPRPEMLARHDLDHTARGKVK